MPINTSGVAVKEIEEIEEVEVSILNVLEKLSENEPEGSSFSQITHALNNDAISSIMIREAIWKLMSKGKIELTESRLLKFS